jgi:hypothetical protein
LRVWSQARASFSVIYTSDASCLSIPRHSEATVNALSGSLICRFVCAATGSPKRARDCRQPPSELGGFRSTQIESDPWIESKYGAGGSRTRRRHEAGPIQTESAHDESGQRIELNAGLSGLEADDGIRRDARSGCERFQADALALAFLTQARSNASRDGPHGLPRTGAAGAERSPAGGRTDDDMMASEEAGGLPDQLD